MNCLDEGLLQALIDGELSAESRRGAEAHLASCASCAAAREEAARESAFFSQAFAVDESLTVPTERLRAGVAAAVAEMRPAGAFEVAGRRGPSGARSFWSSLAASLAPRRVAVFASVALVAVALAAAFVALRPGKQAGGGGPSGVAKGTGAPAPVGGTSNAGAAPSPAVSAATEPGGESVAKGLGPKTVRPGLDKNPPKAGPPQMVKNPPGPIRPADKSRAESAAAPPRPKRPVPDLLLPVEREYAREIATLSNSIERQKLRTLSPTLRAEYERNVAVVDEAIASTRAAVKSNPADRDAQDFLRAAYQEKLDLLSAVAGKSQLASADR